MTNQELEIEIALLKKRNNLVELNKAWEVSKTRKVFVACTTYLCIVLFFYFAEVSKPFVNAIVPTIGYLLSTLSIPWLKDFWIKKNAQYFK